MLVIQSKSGMCRLRPTSTPPLPPLYCLFNKIILKLFIHKHLVALPKSYVFQDLMSSMIL